MGGNEEFLRGIKWSWLILVQPCCFEAPGNLSDEEQKMKK